ncbi:phosphonate ABC transporter substrate-binding protein [Magnetospirillum sp. UT-4]|uniref:phosphonate ABC transporter substrate-binding protein n=1 Tax=Magnetospirillum sp. UT-4 TaxID=2681467 RepID=UPI00137D3448|nr:phosphonate ABC transporter substrate-binding protein [Magnetospirillum sp. UT-4]CAA7626435.1 phosphonate/organophosphate ester transporter subunit; periplasmic binding component of ABC superfamily [Magnetospirillum sp. UT-4]
MKITHIALAAAAAVGTFAATSASAMETLNFGIISTESTTNLKQEWVPFIEAMEKQTGLKVRPFFAPDYAGVIEGMRFNKVQVAWFGNKSAMEAVDRSGGAIFAQSTDPQGGTGYWSHVLVHKDSPISSVAELLKKAPELSFGNGDPNSTSGYLVPGYYVFAQNGITDPKKVFKRVVSANHETNALAVANKQVDAATNNNENLDRIKDRQPDKFNQIKIIWTSPLIPSDPIVWRKDLPKDISEKVYTFFMTYGVPAPGKSQEQVKQEVQVLGGLKWGPFLPSNDDQLLPIRQLELFKSKSKLEADATLPAAEKAAKLAEINGKLAALEKKMAMMQAAKK